MQSGITEEQRAALRAIGVIGRAARRQVGHICPVCGVTFTGLVQAVTCSGKCRTKQVRQRQQQGQEKG